MILSYVAFYNFYCFSSFIYILDFFLVKLGIWCQVRLQSHYFACVYTVFMHHFLKMTFPIEWSCQNLFNHIHAGLFLNCLVYLISLYICLYAEIEKPIQKFIWNLESKTILKINNKMGKLTLHVFKT